MTTNIARKQVGHFIDDKGRIIGMVLDMNEAEYHKVKAFSYSFSKAFKKSPAHGKAYLSREWEISPDRELYKAVHMMALEGKSDRIVVKDGRWAGAVKEEVEALQAQGKIVLKQEAFERAQEIADAIKAHSLAGMVLAHSMCEVSMFWMQDGVYCKARIDILSITSHGIILGDLKNFGDCSRTALLNYQIAKNDYHLQLALYSKAIEAVLGSAPIKRFWIFVEGEAPHGVRVLNCGEAMIDRAWAEMSALIAQYKEVTETDNWHSYAEEELEATLPEYAWSLEND
jgi:hypothetical protein